MERPCPYCTEILNPRQKNHCGQPDCKRGFQRDRMRQWFRDHKAKTGERYGSRYERKPKQHAITCQQCGIEAVVTKANAAYCSHACFYDARYGVDRAPKPTRTWISGRCRRCGDWYLVKNAGMGPAYCSGKCRERESGTRRRALIAGATVGSVSRWRVHERDGWTCHICGDPVDRDAVVPDLAAPVLDHVIALARGGPHSEDNLKTAHFYCNSVKRDLVDGWLTVEA